MEIGLAARMAQRPVRLRAVFLFDHGAESDPQGSGRDLRGATLAIRGELVNRPLARWRKVVFAVAARALLADEYFEAGMAPQAVGEARLPARRDAQPLEITVADDAHDESPPRSAHARAQAANCVAAKLGVTTKRDRRQAKSAISPRRARRCRRPGTAARRRSERGS